MALRTAHGTRHRAPRIETRAAPIRFKCRQCQSELGLIMRMSRETRNPVNFLYPLVSLFALTYSPTSWHNNVRPYQKGSACHSSGYEHRAIRGNVGLCSLTTKGTEDDYPDVVRKAFGDRYSELPYVTGEIKTADFTSQEWEELRNWLGSNDTLNRFKQELTTMAPSPIHDRIIALLRTMNGERWAESFRPPKWIRRALDIDIGQAEYASVRGKKGNKIVGDMVEAISVGDVLVVTDVNETAKSQPVYTTDSEEGALPKIVDIADVLMGNTKVDGAGVPSCGLIALSCFNIEELQPGKSAKAKWSSPETKEYTVNAITYDEHTYKKMLRENPDLISGAGPFIAEHKATFFGAVRVWWIYVPVEELDTLRLGVRLQWKMEEWVARGLAIPILEYYDDNMKPLVEKFLRKVRNGYEKRLATLAKLLSRREHKQTLLDALKLVEDDNVREAQAEEMLTYIRKLLHPSDEALCYDEDVHRIIRSIREGARGTAVDRLRNVSLLKGQAAVALQGSANSQFIAAVESEEDKNDIEEEFFVLSKQALKRKRDSTSDGEGEQAKDRLKERPSSS
ncbi:uncharacterized protein B0H18DRAFT_957917 [Fomitopsis serialis]|uniref:uncharacterized protein n=1 Tax=Fomitopsis serialis TaxID=139415 RepID=UPI002007BA4F|nr:uncharacterized protein B0H18DRAFT_957917 [Neoantrodia serialis]KAH9918423.1 hypothetical protein B0H18DRAFT_957917 [Neoantrodia serialis]